MGLKRIGNGVWIGLWLLLSIFLVGCGAADVGSQSDGTENHSSEHEATASDETRNASGSKQLRIGYQKSSVLLFLKESGNLEKRLAERGFEVSWFEFQSGPPLLEALNAGKIDVGYAGGAPIVLATAHSGSQVVYLAYEPEVYRAIVVPEDSPVHRVEALKGKRVAYGKGSSAHYLVLTALESAGLGLKDVTSVFLQPSDARSAFERKSVDAWAIWDPFLADAENHGARVVIDAHGLPRQYGFIVGRRDYFLEYPFLQEIIIEELAHIHQEIQRDRKLAAEKFAEQTGIVQEVWELTLSRREYGVFPLTDEVLDAQQHIADAFLKEGLLQEPVNVRDAVLP
ncbi:MAG: sulfonate ABC transporter substrate-binding protein [Bacillaceae bacterium G1]|nr:aliphatic sulfonates ABC transporter substrate-binding protein [Bacillota bacterium]OJF17537.1 MAG: sulfonate ABC transporter substrate-binding protein [Bacillaceae bacterium G1]